MNYAEIEWWLVITGSALCVVGPVVTLISYLWVERRR